MILEELRKKALYQNSIEIWIGVSEEKKIDWVNTDNYQKFIAFLLKNELDMNAILASLLYKKHPSQVKFVLVDPKKVELTLFNKIER